MNPIWCNKCSSDIEGVHYGSCPDHPNNIALSKRITGQGINNSAADTAVYVDSISQQNTSDPMKNSWFSGETTLEFDGEQVKKIMEYFIHRVLDLPETYVVSCQHRAGTTRVTFKQRPPEPVVKPLREDERAAIDEMISEGQTNQGD